MSMIGGNVVQLDIQIDRASRIGNANDCNWTYNRTRLFISKHIYCDSLAGNGIILTLEKMKMELGSRIPVLSLIYGNYGGLATNG